MSHKIALALVMLLTWGTKSSAALDKQNAATEKQLVQWDKSAHKSVKAQYGQDGLAVYKLVKARLKIINSTLGLGFFTQHYHKYPCGAIIMENELAQITSQDILDCVLAPLESLRWKLCLQEIMPGGTKILKFVPQKPTTKPSVVADHFCTPVVNTHAEK